MRNILKRFSALFLQNKLQDKLQNKVQDKLAFNRKVQILILHHLRWVVDVKLISEKKMKSFHKKYKGIAKTTDVLSFSAAPEFLSLGIRGVLKDVFLGDILICLPILKKQAIMQKHSPRLELEVLLVHGVLHLFGFEHEGSSKEAKVMKQWEKLLLMRKGLIERSLD